MLDIRKYLFFDIETVGKHKDLSSLKEKEPKLYQLLSKKFQNKSSKEKWGNTLEEMYRNLSPIMPEYGKIVCISIGYMDNNYKWKIKSYVGNEKTLLEEVAKVFNSANNRGLIPCGYNIVLFDIPWLNKKMMKYRIRIPYNILTFNKKPWEINVLDLSDVWRSSGRYWSSFDEVTYELEVESPKSDIDGSQVHNVFWVDNDMQRIIKYCEKDVKGLKDSFEVMIESLN